LRGKIKGTVSYFKLLIEHSQREYEPSPEHILKRMLVPLCRNLDKLLVEGTKNDAWLVIEGLSKECKRLKSYANKRNGPDSR